MRIPIHAIVLLTTLTVGLSGCYCRFRAYRARVEAGKVVFTDADEVALPLFAPRSIPVIDEDDDTTVGCAERPAREYCVIGAVEGAADDAWSREVIESNFRRAAHALRGDAVILQRGVFSKLHSGYTYYGRVIRWQADPLSCPAP